MKRSILLCVIAVSIVQCNLGQYQAVAARPGTIQVPLTDEQKQEIRDLVAKFRDANTQGQRLRPLKRVVSMGPEAAGMASAAVDELLAVCQKQFFELLDKHVRAA